MGKLTDKLACLKSASKKNPRGKAKAKAEPKRKAKPKAKAKAAPRRSNLVITVKPDPADTQQTEQHEKSEQTEKPKGWRFPKGNKFWQCRAKHGRNGIWATPEALLEDCLAYFDWLEDNPLLEEKGFAFQGVVTHDTFAKMRVATLEGLQLHLGISDQCWRNYRQRADFIGVVEYVEKAIRYHKFSGAAADLLNASIIARDLGLRDVVQNEHTGAGGGPIQTITTDMPAEQASEIYRELIRGRG